MIPKITVTGQFFQADGSPQAGWIGFELAAPIVDSTNDLISTTQEQGVKLDKTGSFSIELHPTNHPLTTPANNYYTVRKYPLDTNEFTIQVAVPYDTVSPINFGDLPIAANLPPLQYAAIGAQGPQGPIGPQGSQGPQGPQAISMPQPPIMPTGCTTQLLTSSMQSVAGSTFVIHTGLFSIPPGATLQARVIMMFDGHTAGDVLQVEAYDEVSASIVIPAASLTTANTYRQRIETTWVNVPTSPAWRGVLRARNSTAVRGNAKQAWIELRFV